MGKRTRRGTELPETVFCDASYLIAFFAPSDSAHEKARRIRKRFKDRPVRLFTLWPLLSEAATILLYHYGYAHASALLQAVRAFTVLTPDENDYVEASALFKEWNRDQKLSLNDLLTYVIVKGRLKDMPVLSFDRDIVRMRLRIVT